MQYSDFQTRNAQTFPIEQEDIENREVLDEEKNIKASQLKELKLEHLNATDFDDKDIAILSIFLENSGCVFPLLVLEIKRRGIGLTPEAIRKRLERKYLPRNLVIKINGSNPVIYNLNHYAIPTIKTLLEDHIKMTGILSALSLARR